MSIKQGGICIYYKVFLPLKTEIIYHLREFINFEVRSTCKLCNFITLSLTYSEVFWAYCYLHRSGLEETDPLSSSFENADYHLLDKIPKAMRFTCFRMIYNEQSMFSLYVIIMSHTSFRVNPHSRVCLNVKEPLAWSRSHIWSLSHSNVIRTHNHLVCKWTLNHLAKLASLAKRLSVRLWIKWLWVPITLLSPKVCFLTWK